jgi:diguanylate cyclase (GGDEF)-like protein
MKGELTAKAVGRIAGYLFIASGLLSALAVPLPRPDDSSRGFALAIAGLAVAAGGIAYLFPWERFHRRVTLVLLPVAFLIIASGNLNGPTQASYAVFFIVAFVWLGISHPRNTSFWFAPVAAAAYLAPILLRSDAKTDEASGVALTIPVCVLVAEILARVIESQQRSRRVAQALARSASQLGRHMQQADVCQSLVDEARQALGAERAMLFQIDADTTLTAAFMSGFDVETTEAVQAVIGTKADWIPNELTAGEPLIVEDTSGSARDAQARERFGVKSYIAIPVVSSEGLVGMLSCAELTRPRKYDDELISIAKGLAGQASAAFQNATLYEQTLAASRSDALTGLGNRRAFRERLESEVERARRYGRDLGLLVLDIDRFKSINDTFGHQAGDRALMHLGDLLQGSRRMEDGAFRIGGDEFALILPETPQKGVAVKAERLRRSIEHAAIAGERDVPLTVSIGMSSFGEHGINVDELFERADTALYEVKGAGGNAVSLPRPLSGTARLGVDIERVIRDVHLEAHYQPIFDVRTGHVMAFEGFSRLDPAFGFTPTPTLFRAAAATSRLEALDKICRAVVLSGCTTLEPNVLLFLNVSPAVLESERFGPEELIDAIAGVDLDPSQVVIEITEYERTPRSRQLARNVHRCREAGLKVALDDFGAGGADLDLLAGIRFDYVKVDMSFVQGANGIDTRRRVLSGLKLLAVESDALTIAEGIETLDDLRLVQELGFSGAQGFLLREPARSLDHSSRPLRIVADTVDA